MTDDSQPATQESALHHQRLRQGLIATVKHGIEAKRNDASKWDPLYRWFADEFGIGEGHRGGPVIGKLVTEHRQIGNRCAEMAESNPEIAVIALLDGVTSDQMLKAMAKRGRLPSLKVAIFFHETTPERFVIFDD